MRIKNSPAENIRPNLISFNALAPNITGIDKKKENLTAIVLEVPKITAPSIVAC